MIRCPECRRDMRQVTVRALPGQLIVLDQCGRCGGLWCDKWELFPTDCDEAARVDPLNEALLQDLTMLRQKPLYCPRCTAPLEVFAEPMLPKDIQLQRCGRCDGIWLNRGQFRRYKEFQKQTRMEKLGAASIVAKLPAVYEDPKSWTVTGAKGIFAYPQGEAAEDVVEKSIGASVEVILQSLLRLVLGI